MKDDKSEFLLADQSAGSLPDVLLSLVLVVADCEELIELT
jgi:hypothetical protein